MRHGLRTAGLEELKSKIVQALTFSMSWMLPVRTACTGLLYEMDLYNMAKSGTLQEERMNIPLWQDAA